MSLLFISNFWVTYYKANEHKSFQKMVGYYWDASCSEFVQSWLNKQLVKKILHHFMAIWRILEDCEG